MLQNIFKKYLKLEESRVFVHLVQVDRQQLFCHTRHSIQLLQHRVDITGGPAILQTNIVAVGPPRVCLMVRLYCDKGCPARLGLVHHASMAPPQIWA